MSQGRRYTREEKKEILQFRLNHTYQETSQKFGVSEMTLARWARRIDTNTSHLRFDKLIDTNTSSQKDRIMNLNYNSWLQVIGAIEEVKAVAIISDFGEILAFQSRENLREDIMMVQSISLLSVIDAAISRLYKENLKMIFIQTSEVIFFFIEAGAHNLLSIFLKPPLDTRKFFAEDFPLIEKIRNLIEQANNDEKSIEKVKKDE